MNIATSFYAALVALGLTLHGFTIADMAGVTISSDPSPKAGGYACHEVFRGVPGNVQDWCPPHGDAGHVVVSAMTITACIHHAIDTGRPASRYCRPAADSYVTFLLAHELAHLVIGVDHGHADPFREDLADLAGYCAAGWTLTERLARLGIDACDWRDHIPARGAR